MRLPNLLLLGGSFTTSAVVIASAASIVPAVPLSNTAERSLQDIHANAALTSVKDPVACKDAAGSSVKNKKKDTTSHGHHKQPKITNSIRNLVVDNTTIDEHNFYPLPCNDITFPSLCPPLLIPPSGSTIETKIPCGQCATLNFDSNTETILGGGLHIEGKLIIDTTNKNRVIKTPYVIVSGELVYDQNDEVTPDNESVRFVLTGMTEKYYKPPPSNAHACVGRSVGQSDVDMCNLGIKPFAVVGGKVTITALKPDAPTWVKLQSVVTDTMPIPTNAPVKPTPPDGCDASGVIFDSNFESGTMEGWRGIYGTAFNTMTNETADNTCLVIDDRKRVWQGPQIDITSNCLQADVDYIFKAKIKMYHADGNLTNCAAGIGNHPDDYCLRIKTRAQVFWTDWNRDRDFWATHGTIRPAIMGVDGQNGEWFIYEKKMKFHHTHLDNMVFMELRMDGPERGVVIELDDISLTLPTEDMFPQTCTNLIPGLPLESGTREYVYPVTSTNAHLKIDSDDSTPTPYYSLVDRHDNWASLTFPLLHDCLVENALYKLNLSVRLHSDTLITNAYMEIELWPNMDNGDGYTRPRLDISMPDIGMSQWVDVSTYITITKAMADSARSKFRLVTGSNRYDTIDYKDLSFDFIAGPTVGLVVDKAVEGNWGVGSEVVITSHTPDWKDTQVRTITSVTTDTTYSTLTLDEHIPRPSTMDDHVDYAVEVGLLSRNLKIMGEDSVELNGGHMIIMNTTAVEQRVEGVDFDNMGQQGTLGRYPIHLHMCKSTPLSLISKNTIRNSNQRCIVLHGTDDTTVSNNVAYNTFGHCYMLEDRGEINNLFQTNLGCVTKNIPDAGRIIIDGRKETDGSASTYWCTNPQNRWIENVAAGSQESGYWFEMHGGVRGDTRFLDGRSDMRPNQLGLLEFRGNVAHSNHGPGIRTYPHGYIPAEEAVFMNTKVYRNKNDGFFFHNSRNLAVRGGYISDNDQGIDIDRADSVRVTDVTITGVSDAYLEVNTKNRSIWRHCPNSGRDLWGIQFHYYNSNMKYWYPGGNVSGVTFQGFKDTGCYKSGAIGFDNDMPDMHFDYFTQLSNNNIADDSPIVDGCTVMDINVDDMILTDLDSSLNPTGSGYVGTSSFVSNSTYMMEFAGDACTVIDGQCYAYCEGACLRAVAFRTDIYDTEDVVLQITESGSSKTAVIPGKMRWHNSQYHDSWYERYRTYGIALPAGSYSATFLNASNNMEPIIPRFVDVQYEPKPDCVGHLADNAIELSWESVPLPANQCDELIVNGDVEEGNYTHWGHNGGHSIQEANAGVDGSYAIRSNNRHWDHHGIIQHIQPRCLNENVGQEYEITGMVRLETKNGETYDPWDDCDPNANNYNDACPSVTIYFRKRDPITAEYSGQERSHQAQVIRGSPTDANGFRPIHGVFTVGEYMTGWDYVFVMVSRTRWNVQIVLDNFSIKKFNRPAGCSGELIVNGNFDDDMPAKFWDDRDGAKIDIIPKADGTVNELRNYERNGKHWSGFRQVLNPYCFTKDQKYEITIEFRLEKDGQHVTCDKNQGNVAQIDKCPEARFYVWSPTSWGWPVIAYTSDPGDENRYGVMHNIYTATEQVDQAQYNYFYVERLGNYVDIIVKSVSIKPMVTDCADLITNGQFDTDGRGWERYGGGSNDIEVVFDASEGNALKSVNRADQGWGMLQYLDKSCLKDGDNWSITAQVKMTDPSQSDAIVECNPEHIRGEHGCPVATLKTISNNEMYRNVGFVDASVEPDVNGWYHLHGVFTVAASDEMSNHILVYFKNAPVGIDLWIRDVKIHPVTVEE